MVARVVLNCELARDVSNSVPRPAFNLASVELEGGLLVFHVPLGDGQLVLLDREARSEVLATSAMTETCASWRLASAPWSLIL